MVSAVVDGNTIELDGKHRIHLIGIQNTPEAQRYLENNIYRRKVRIIFDSRSRVRNAERSKELIPGYARTIQKESINGTMLKLGICGVDTEFLQDSLSVFQHYASNQDALNIAYSGSAVTAGMPFVDLVKKVDPAVFLIYSFVGEDPIGQGTGFYVSSDGTAVSNYHVFEGGDRWFIKMYEKEDLIPVKSVVTFDREYDFIIFRVGIDQPVDFFNLANGYPTIGEEIFVIGNPTRLERTVTKGIVSAQRSIISENDYFQIDAAISPGSSGSPVCNRTAT